MTPEEIILIDCGQYAIIHTAQLYGEICFCNATLNGCTSFCKSAYSTMLYA